MVESRIRLNFVEHPESPDSPSDRYRAGIEMAAWGEGHGVGLVTHEEHHGVPCGWSPSPLVTAAAIAARTERVRLMISAMLLPLHDPLRLAEDIAVVDLVSAGRLTVLGGIGHRPEEYAAHGKDWDRRGALMDESVDTLLKAWAGEPFDHHGTTVLVTPRPHSRRPPLILGGNSKPAARRAARFRLPILFASHQPELADYYTAECQRHGWNGMAMSPPAGFHHQFVVDDPDRAWATYGRYLLHEANVYATFRQVQNRSAVHAAATTVDELRALGTYRFLTPAEAVTAFRAATGAGGRYPFNLHPLCGGLPIDAAWEMLERWAGEVLPHLA